MPFQLQERDIKILKFVYASRVVSQGQISSRYFNGCHPTAAYRRLKKLRSDNLLMLESTVVNDESQEYICLTEKGWELICNSWPFTIESPLLKSDSPAHDLRLNEIFFRFEKLKSFKSFMTENLLQTSSTLKTDIKFRDLSRLNADGALVLIGPDQRTYVYGIELELSKKSPERYQEKLKSYYRADGIDGVIYITSHQAIQNSLAKIDEDLCKLRDSILYLGSEADVLRANQRMYFRNTKMNGIELF